MIHGRNSVYKESHLYFKQWAAVFWGQIAKHGY